jgi:hypothetical protein
MPAHSRRLNTPRHHHPPAGTLLSALAAKERLGALPTGPERGRHIHAQVPERADEPVRRREIRVIHVPYMSGVKARPHAARALDNCR